VTFELRSFDRDGHQLGEPLPIANFADAVSTYETACDVAREYGGSYQLLEDGTVLLSMAHWPEEER
jgi:hypothetical protein